FAFFIRVPFLLFILYILILKKLNFILLNILKFNKYISHFSTVTVEKIHISNQKLLNTLSDENFYEWFRGFVDAEGCFLIQVIKNQFKLVFTLCLHKDETPLLEYIMERLGVGYLSVREKMLITLFQIKMIYLRLLAFLTNDRSIQAKI
uniref:hypothetical protein n=1 Tax=Drechslerella dactyloides TaxID=74499 RepID=UPI0022FD76F8